MMEVFGMSSAMKKVATLTMLLVCLVSVNAHDTNTKGWNFFQSPHHVGKPSKRYRSDGHSVVENWFLVCNDLCGAGFGGSKCGLYCLGGRRDGKPNNKFNSTLVCPSLCDFELGGAECNCPIKSSKRLPSVKNICDIFCTKYNININGCSQCEFKIPTESKTTTTTTTTTTTITPEQNDDKSKPDPNTDHPVPKIFEPPPDSTNPDELDPSNNEPPPDSTYPDQTPDWSEMCIDLCKDGAGGALCNCDLPPLMFSLK